MSLPVSFDYLRTGIEDRSLRITIVGLGYVGLPSAISFHEAGFPVRGLDTSEEVINSLLTGESKLLDEIGKSAPSGKNWTISSNYHECIPESDVVIVCVPTPVDSDRKPNLNPVRKALESIISSRNADSDLVIILESTVQPGTTRKCISSSVSHHGLQTNQISMAYCPERVSPGEGGFGVQDVSRVIGSNDTKLSPILAELYGTITSGGVRVVDSIEVAEASKLVENAQRDIDIAFVNELAILLPKLGLDVEDVLSAASTKWNFHRHKPGLGVGGHCIPIDPHYYIEIAKRNGVSSAMSPAARELNSSMPKYSANEVVRLCGGTAPKKVLVLGFSYKPNVSDSRETPVVPLINELFNLGTIEVLVWDPFIDASKFPDKITSIPDPYDHEGVDCIIIATAHDQVKELNWKEMAESVNVLRIFDGRRCLKPSVFLKNDWIYHALGRPLGGL